MSLENSIHTTEIKIKEGFWGLFSTKCPDNLKKYEKYQKAIADANRFMRKRFFVWHGYFVMFIIIMLLGPAIATLVSYFLAVYAKSIEGAIIVGFGILFISVCIIFGSMPLMIYWYIKIGDDMKNFIESQNYGIPVKMIQEREFCYSSKGSRKQYKWRVVFVVPSYLIK